MKIITIIGARPQFIKAAVVSRAIEKSNNENANQHIEEIIIHTGQHYDTNMSDVFFEEMHIPKPKYNLHIGGGTHGAMTGQMLEKIEAIILSEKPDVVLVYGDTNSTLAGALAAAKIHIPVAHVEAGLRSFNMDMPEEVNRILTDRVSKWLLAPTQTAMDNLKDEGFPFMDMQVECVGDVMYDAALFYQQNNHPTAALLKMLNKFDNFYLATIHRAENTDNFMRLKNIIDALEAIAQKVSVILPLHPRTRKILAEMNIATNHIVTIEPVGYFDMIALLEQCAAVFTDSGGVQKEAYFFKKPCITLRDETEWMELVQHGFNVLVGADKDKILAAETNLKNLQCDFSKELYGNGQAGEKIIHYLIEG